MATSTFTQQNNSSSDTLFRAWGSALNAALAAVGLTQVSTSAGGDTGQINWTTVVAPSGGVFAGYELWQFNDALQSASPITFKLQYGSGSNFGGMLSIQVGTGFNSTSNNGTITGNLTVIYTCGTNTSLGSATPCYVSSDGSRCQVMMFVSASTGANTAWGFSLSRTVNNSGAYTNVGTELFLLGGSQNPVVQHLFQPSLANGGAALIYTAPQCAAPPAGTASYNSNIGLFPLFPPMGNPGNPTMGVCGYFQSDISATDTNQTFTMYGANHTFKCIRSDGAGGTGATAMRLNGNTNTAGYAFRYE